MDNSTRNTHVYSTTSRKMGESGFNRTTVECHQRIKTLKKNYFQVQNSNKSSGQGQVSCRYYDEIDRMLGNRPYVTLTPLKVKDSYEPVDALIDEDSIESVAMSGLPSTFDVDVTKDVSFSHHSVKSVLCLDCQFSFFK